MKPSFNNIYIPWVKIQPDWYQVLENVLKYSGNIQYLNELPTYEKSFWFNVGFKGSNDIKFMELSVLDLLKQNNEEKLVHKQKVQDHEIEFIFEIKDVLKPKLKINIYKEKQLLQNIKYYSQAVDKLEKIGAKGYKTMDLSPQGDSIVVGASDGYLKHFTKDLEIIKDITGHFGTLNQVKYFPSSKVLLTASDDLMSKVISLEDYDNPVALKGHTQAITSLAIVDRGKNVLTAAKDGKVILWNLGHEKILHAFNFNQAIINIEILHLSQLLNSENVQPVEDEDALESSTKGKLLAVATANIIYFVDLKSRKTLSKQNIKLNINTLKIIQDKEDVYVFIGFEQGDFGIYKLDECFQLVEKDKIIKCDSVVNQFFYLNSKLWVAYADGTISLFALKDQKLFYTSEILVDDLDPILAIQATDFNQVWAYTRDSILAHYNLE